MKSLVRKGIDYNIFTGKLNDLPLSGKTVISTINQYSFCIAEKDANFKRALQESEILLPDGDGVVFAERLLTGKKIRKVSGTDLHLHLLAVLNKKKGRCFYLGSSSATLDKIGEKLKKEFPNIEVAFYAPPFRLNFTNEDSNQMISAINTFKPDVLFIGLTAPKQEKWANKHKSQIDANIICCIGAVFDFYAETVKRPGQLWIDMHLEWFGRFLNEPKRMWRRYIYYGPVYLFFIIKRRFYTK